MALAQGGAGAGSINPATGQQQAVPGLGSMAGSMSGWMASARGGGERSGAHGTGESRGSAASKGDGQVRGAEPLPLPLPPPHPRSGNGNGNGGRAQAQRKGKHKGFKHLNRLYTTQV